MYNYNYTNPSMVNQLYRQRENIDNMINQYSSAANQPPVQNIINTSNSSDIDVRFLNPNEDVTNILVTKRTLFIDESKSEIKLKELNGEISKSYQIIVPKDEKDLKIEELEGKLKELEERIGGQYTKSDITNANVESTNTSTNKSTKPATKVNF